jgi:two-component system, chemotaxis family, sensor histidine kinase and response regulator PixL
MNTEQEMRLQFLDEAEEYIDTIEMGILALNQRENLQSWDAVLRAAHSIKGGAAMMGYEILSGMAHYLEDFFKIIKVNPSQSLTSQVEADLFSSVDCLRRSIVGYRQSKNIDQSWLTENFDLIFNSLREQLGELTEEIYHSTFSDETGEDLAVFFFETEVESCLERLDKVLSNSELEILREEFRLAVQELAGLGEMLEITNYSLLCNQIESLFRLVDDSQLFDLATIALNTLKRSQALVIIGQREAIPTSIKDFKLINSVSELSEVNLEDLIEFSDDNFDFLGELPSQADLIEFSEDNFDFLAELPEQLEPITTELSDNSPVIASIIEDIPDDSQTTVTSLFETDLIFPNPLENLPDNSEQIVRVPTRQLEKLGDLVGELTIDRNGLNLQLASVQSLFALLNQKVSILSQTNQSLRNLYDGIDNTGIGGKEMIFNPSAPTFDQFDRLEMDRYSDLHSICQELMETIVQIQEVTSDIDTNLDSTKRTSRSITRTSQILQNQLTQVRQRPFSDLVARYPRVVRELSQRYSKKVNLSLFGGDILIDRTVIAILADPILHLLRNAFDHGIEDAETRQLLGKPPEGKIEISATYRGSQTIITIADDGGGIDPEKISARVVQMGLNAEYIQKLSKNELLNFIFEPGFSTAATVTELSGRGIGMNIVQTKVASLRGQIQIESQLGKGTTFIISLPLTLSILRVLLVESGGILLAFPTSTIEEMLIPTPEMRISREGKSLLNWEGYLVPLLNLREHFHFARPVIKPETMTMNAIIKQSVVLIVESGDRLVALEVDSYFGEQEVTLRTIENAFPLPPGFVPQRGSLRDRCTILGDGRVVPLANPDSLIEAIERAKIKTRSTIPVNNTPDPITVINQKDLIMVVDDSINVRRFLAATLEKAGYRVQQAKDGQDAWEKLQEGSPIKAVICDIEMPRLDGFGFLAQVRAKSQFQQLPIFMLTSRSGDKHRQIAFNLGASAYFSKPFPEQELLDTLKMMINQPSVCNYSP